jgi:tetratricopeptide (TPR) repeat protein
LLGLKRTTPQETIEELEKLRFAWRGDEFEFDLLRKLGHLYLSIGDYRNGLRTLRQAVTYFSDNPHAPEVTQEMAAAFADLYLNDRADSLPPVTAIALYDEFKELTPSGEKGDEMIRKLADRLASVDLLDRAAVLLSRQVAFRLKGTEKARVGTQLALVHLLNREPKKALAALKDSEDGKIPDDLRVQRRHLNARALIDLGRQPEALALLDKDESVEADLLRTEIYWDAKDWSNAAHVLRRLVAAKGAHPGKPVNKTQANFVLNLAVALTLSGNQRGVARIRQEYGQAMGETQLRDAFNLVTSPNTVGLVDYRTIAGKVKEATDFGTFMAAYRERLKSGELSRVN